MNLVSQSPSNSVQTTPNKWNATTNGILSDQSPTSDYVDDSSISAADSSSSSLNSPIPQTHTLPTPLQQQQMKQQAQTRYRHPHTIPYDPMVHITNKPPYSFSCLIFMAIEDSERKALPVKEIYSWIMDHFPYFKTAPTGWKNSVRHNLSLNKCFQKVEKAPVLINVLPRKRVGILVAMIFRFGFTESRQRLAVEGRSAVSPESVAGVDALAVPSLLDTGSGRLL